MVGGGGVGWGMALRCAVAGLLLGVAEAPPGPEPPLSLAWASSPVFANETLLLHGTFAESSGGGGRGPRLLRVELTPLDPGQAAAPLVLEPALPPSAVSLMVALPPSLPDSAYSVRVLGGNGKRSNALEINQPEAWWVQGDAGNFSTPGGWVRVFGRALTLAGRQAAPHPAESADEPEAVETSIREAIAAGNLAELDRLHESQRARAVSQRQRLAQTNTTLHLAPAGGGTPVTLTAVSAPFSFGFLQPKEAWLCTDGYDVERSVPGAAFPARRTVHRQSEQRARTAGADRLLRQPEPPVRSLGRYRRGRLAAAAQLFRRGVWRDGTDRRARPTRWR